MSLRRGQVSQAAVCQVEDQRVERRRHQRYRAEPQQHEVDLHRIDERIEVRRPVARFVDRPDGHFGDADGLLPHGDQHVQLEVVAIGLQPQQARQQSGGDAAQAGLRVRDMLAHQRAHHRARDDIAHAAAPGAHPPLKVRLPRTMRSGSAASRIGDLLDVVGMVLAVGVRGDHSL
jgi:hypothetical protein